MQARAGKADLVCTFTYKAMGGTNEHWVLSLTEDKGAHVCQVKRCVQPRMHDSLPELAVGTSSRISSLPPSRWPSPTDA